MRGFTVIGLIAMAFTLADLKPHASQTRVDPGPQFEVASIKPSREDGPANYWEISGRRFTGRRSQVTELIRLAWADSQLRLEGAPEWTSRDRYDIVANGEVDIAPGAPALASMMRSLLAQRFNLLSHKATRDIPIFALVPARADRRLGPKLQNGSADCALVTGASMAPGTCGPGFAPGRFRFANITMAGLALLLSRQIGNRVIDDTGLSGGYKIDLEFVPERVQPAPEQSQAALDGSPLLEALSDQLGLKLIPRRASIEVLVIDHIERPTPD